MNKEIDDGYNDIVKRDFNEADREFWYEKYGISKEILAKYNVCPISSFKSKGKFIIPPLLAYSYDIGNGFKIYQPLSPNYKFIYIGRKEENFIFGYNQLPEKGNIVFIAAGEKDVLNLAMRGYNAICLNSETANLPVWLYEDLNKRFQKIIVIYDNDKTGVENSFKLITEFNLSRVELPEMTDGKDVSDYIFLGHSLETLFRLQLPLIFGNKFSVSSFDDLAVVGNSLEAVREIWGCFVLENSLIVFPAERGIGKTFLMLELALMVANEAESFCGEVISLHGNVLYINLELGEAILSRRMEKLLKSLPIKKSKYKAYCLTFSGNFLHNLKEVEKHISNLKPVLIIIDNMRAASSHIDNEKNKSVVTFIQDLQAIMKKYNCAVILVHHTKKGTQNQRMNSDMQSGAGALTDLADGDFFLGRSTQDKNYRLLKRIKSRNCEEQSDAKLLHMNPNTLWFEVINESVNEGEHIVFENKETEKRNRTFEMKKLHSEGKTLEEIAVIFGVNKSTVSRRINE